MDGLNFSELGFGRSVPAATGRPPYDPRDLLKLYRLSPDFKTIADFRRDKGVAIVGACRAFVMLCRDAGLFTARPLPPEPPVLKNGPPVSWLDGGIDTAGTSLVIFRRRQF